MKSICAASIIVGYAFIIISLQASILVAQKNISRLQIEIERMSADIKVKRAKLSANPNLKEIETQALALGMKYPLEGQIIYYSTKDPDYTVYYGN